MALRIETFSNVKGGNAFYKAISHPLAGRKAAALIDTLASGGPVALYDPLGFAAPFASLYDLSGLELEGLYVQDIEDIGKTLFDQRAQPVTDLPGAAASQVFVAAFDAEPLIAQIRHLLPAGAKVVSLDALRLPDDMLTDRRHYLNGLNFATNFVFFRDAGGHHTRLVTANYWSGYGAKDPEFWCCLFDGAGKPLAEWRIAMPGAGGLIEIDSAAVRERFGLDDFTGQLFIHALRIAGHDVVKYALDTYGESAEVLSCTHDANAWPAALYAGLPAPQEDERVTLWVQNSHPIAMPAGSVGLNLMGGSEVAWLEREVPAFGSFALDTRELLPDARWPRQIEVQAGKYMVRPRYEVTAAQGRSRIAHVNVERTDLKPDPKIPELSNLMGKGFLLPAPVLPPDRYRSVVLPTPMSTCQQDLPVTALVYDASGRELAAECFGRLPRDHGAVLEVSRFFEASNGAVSNGRDETWGHMELVYDFGDGGEADGWLHGLFRYEDKSSGHAAETSFGAHMFNMVLTYKGEPQSYAGRAPGLSTRLFLRLGAKPHETFCHLIYPASTQWHAASATTLILHNAAGETVAEREVAIPCGGSLYWRVSEMFGPADLKGAGAAAYVLVRDTTCRLFGYHGLVNGDVSFSCDHMFGF